MEFPVRPLDVWLTSKSVQVAAVENESRGDFEVSEAAFLNKPSHKTFAET